MDAGKIIDRFGGAKAVQELTGLSKGRISQWRTENHIPRAWLKFLETHKPEAFEEPDERQVDLPLAPAKAAA